MKARDRASKMLRTLTIAVCGWSMSVSAMAGGYVATVLPTLGGGSTVPEAIDNSGVVTGESKTAGGGGHAFLWKDGQMIDAGLPSGSGVTGGTGYAVNAAGKVVGTASGGGYPYAFEYEDGVMTTLARGWGHDVNAAGDVVGQIDDGTQLSAFLYAGGILRNLGNFGYDSARAWAINNAGVVAGGTSQHTFAGKPPRGFVWENGEVTFIEPAAGNRTSALDINDAGQVLVTSTVASDPNIMRLFIWKDGVMTDTGLEDSPASGINNQGHVMVSSGVLIDGVFTRVEDMLPPEVAPGSHDGRYWMFPTLTGLNDAGQVTGWINTIDLLTRVQGTVGFVLTPATFCQN